MDKVEPPFRALLAEHPTMPARVIAKRIDFSLPSDTFYGVARVRRLII